MTFFPTIFVQGLVAKPTLAKFSQALLVLGAGAFALPCEATAIGCERHRLGVAAVHGEVLTVKGIGAYHARLALLVGIQRRIFHIDTASLELMGWRRHNSPRFPLVALVVARFVPHAQDL